MKKLLIILLFPILAHAQSVPISLVALSTVTDLRAFLPQNTQMVALIGLSSIDDGNGGNYKWVSASTATDDGFITIQVTGITTGRWVRIGNSNTLKGSTSISAVSLQSTYTVGFGQTFPFTPKAVYITPRSANAAGPFYVSAITTSSFTIVFSSVPLLGTMAFDWLIIKQ